MIRFAGTSLSHLIASLGQLSGLSTLYRWRSSMQSALPWTLTHCSNSEGARQVACIVKGYKSVMVYGLEALCVILRTDIAPWFFTRSLFRSLHARLSPLRCFRRVCLSSILDEMLLSLPRDCPSISPVVPPGCEKALQIIRSTATQFGTIVKNNPRHIFNGRVIASKEAIYSSRRASGEDLSMCYWCRPAATSELSGWKQVGCALHGFYRFAIS